ncbi:MAG: FecR family protein [Acidobacteriota bacterium]
MSDHHSGPTDHDPIADAVRRAGPREPLPEIDLEALAAPARTAWRRKLAQRRRRRQRIVLAAAAVALVGLGVWLADRLVPAQPVGTVVAVIGGDGALVRGSELQPGQRLVTGAGEWLTVELRTGHRLRLNAGTALRLDDAAHAELEAGQIYVEAVPAALLLRASGATIEHVGTRYMISLDGDGLGVRVRDGAVRVVRGAQRLEVARGQQLRDEQGTLQVAPAPTHGEAWSWTRQAAPPFDSDGVELGDFLDWVEAETGWQVEIDPALLLDARGQPVLIQGAVGGSSPEDALEIVLAAAGLRHRVDGDRLHVEAADR